MRKIIKRMSACLIMSFFATSLVACGDSSEQYQITLEGRLIDSFEASDQEVRARVQSIVTASKNNDYLQAMNELAVLSVSQIHNPSQKVAIKSLMTRLRYNMEEEEFSKKKQEPVS